MKVYITKYALTLGVLEVEGKVSDASPDMVSWREAGASTQYAHGNDWHRTHENAVRRAEEMRTKKIASLRKQIAKLEQLKFR